MASLCASALATGILVPEQAGYARGPSIANGLQGPYPSPLANELARWLIHADFVLLYQRRSPYIPWTPQLKRWFDSVLQLVNGASGLWIFKHAHRTPPPFFSGRST